MDEHRAIAELIRSGEKQAGLLRILVIVNVILTVGFLVAFGLLVPKTMNVVGEAEEAVAQVRELSSAAQKSLEGVDQIVSGANTILDDADQMVKDAHEIMDSNTSNMEEALENFNSVDFEALNSTIESLADAVKPLQKLTEFFN